MVPGYGVVKRDNVETIKRSAATRCRLELMSFIIANELDESVNGSSRTLVRYREQFGRVSSSEKLRKGVAWKWGWDSAERAWISFYKQFLD